MKRILIAIAIVLAFSVSVQASAQQEIKFKRVPEQRLDVRYRLFDADNIWTKLLLDTRTGMVWQVSFSVGEGLRAKLPINTKMLMDEKNSKNGRFTLYPTDNMWTFILVDQENGNLWQCAFGIGSDSYRGLIPIPELILEKKINE